MWIKKLRRRKAEPADGALRESVAPPARKNPARPVFWAVLAVAALMLTTFVIFGAGGSGMIRIAPPPGYTESPAVYTESPAAP